MIIAQRLQENASFGAIGKELGTVSYTHLDVYKRQVRQFPMQYRG